MTFDEYKEDQHSQHKRSYSRGTHVCLLYIKREIFFNTCNYIIILPSYLGQGIAKRRNAFHDNMPPATNLTADGGGSVETLVMLNVKQEICKYQFSFPDQIPIRDFVDAGFFPFGI